MSRQETVQATPVADEKTSSGRKLDVVSATLVEASLAPRRKTAARLCDGGGQCIALIETDPGDDDA